jgi:hypothetical protein
MVLPSYPAATAAAKREPLGHALTGETLSVAEEDERRRRLRQQRELVHGSGAPRSVVRALLPGAHPRPARKRRWKDMGRAEKYALIQTQIITWALILVVAYFLATKVTVVLGVAYLALMIGGLAYVLYRVVRDTREP